MKKNLFILIILILSIMFLCLLQLQLSDPYSPYTTIKSPFITSINQQGEIELHKQANVFISDNPFLQFLAFAQSGARMIAFALNSEKPLRGSERQIIYQIHSERFDPTKPYVISGAHFTDLYIRNLGIFYSEILNGCLPATQQDFDNRQRVTLQTLATDLLFLKNVKQEPTTFMPLGSNIFVPVNIYTRASDSLYAITYTLNASQNEDFFQKNNATRSNYCYPLKTRTASLHLLQENKQRLKQLIDNYLSSVIDSKTGLVRTDLTLSSARDGIKRQSSFYDNVIAWSTIKLATKLGIENVSDQELTQWRLKILSAFWDEQTGIFLDDLSVASKTDKLFSADSFIVLQTQFLDPSNSNDQKMLQKMVDYVSSHQLDNPFPLHYALRDNPKQLYPSVGTFATSYMGESIWSHWAMEYIKTVIILSKNNPQYRQQAIHYINLYSNNIRTFGGYPELYNKNGSIFSTLFYKSILHTGWVVNYEATNLLLQNQK